MPPSPIAAGQDQSMLGVLAAARPPGPGVAAAAGPGVVGRPASSPANRTVAACQRGLAAEAHVADEGRPANNR